MIKFSHIGQLHDVVHFVNAQRERGAAIERIHYRGTVKLHGSNAAVVCHADRLSPQSRNREITPDDDNHGFAKFALDEARTAAIRAIEAELRLATSLAPERPLVLFGEWIGPGVQSRVGVAALPDRQWVLFAVATRDDDAEHKRYFELPELGDRFAELGIYSIADAPAHEVVLEFGDRTALEAAAAQIEAATAEIDERCPWAAKFGIEGVGEGLVWQPLGEHFGDSDLLFKTKGPRHQVVARKPKQARGSSLDPEQLPGIAAFVAYAVTEARLEQGLDYLREHGLAVEHRSLGAFLKWISTDIRRECQVELERNGLDWKPVGHAVIEAAKAWFRGRLTPAW